MTVEHQTEPQQSHLRPGCSKRAVAAGPWSRRCVGAAIPCLVVSLPGVEGRGELPISITPVRSARSPRLELNRGHHGAATRSRCRLGENSLGDSRRRLESRTSTARRPTPRREQFVTNDEPSWVTNRSYQILASVFTTDADDQASGHGAWSSAGATLTRSATRSVGRQHWHGQHAHSIQEPNNRPLT